MTTEEPKCGWPKISRATRLREGNIDLQLCTLMSAVFALRDGSKVLGVQGPDSTGLEIAVSFGVIGFMAWLFYRSQLPQKQLFGGTRRFWKLTCCIALVAALGMSTANMNGLRLI